MKNSCKYIEEEQLLINKKQYDFFEEGKDVNIYKENETKTIGIVSHIKDESSTSGLQAYVITDNYVPINASYEERKEVKDVTILYRGSTSPYKVFEGGDTTSDVLNDWLKNNWQITAQSVLPRILYKNKENWELRENHPKEKEKTAQMKATIKSLNEIEKIYPNAKIWLYGHSQSNSNIQVAVLNMKNPERLAGAFLINGPNVYNMLTEDEKNKISRIYDRVHIYADENDIISFGYYNKEKTVGKVYVIDSLKLNSIIAQHDFGGYQIIDGKIKKKELSEWQDQMRKVENNLKVDMLFLNTLEVLLGANGLSENEEIYLDEARTLAILKNIRNEIEESCDRLTREYNRAIQKVEELWKEALKQAKTIGYSLSYNEILEIFKQEGITQRNTFEGPINEYNIKIQQVRAIKQNYYDLIMMLEAKISSLQEKDGELSSLFNLR